MSPLTLVLLFVAAVLVMAAVEYAAYCCGHTDAEQAMKCRRHKLRLRQAERRRETENRNAQAFAASQNH